MNQRAAGTRTVTDDVVSISSKTIFPLCFGHWEEKLTGDVYRQEDAGARLSKERSGDGLCPLEERERDCLFGYKQKRKRRDRTEEGRASEEKSHFGGRRRGKEGRAAVGIGLSRGALLSGRGFF